MVKKGGVSQPNAVLPLPKKGQKGTRKNHHANWKKKVKRRTLYFTSGRKKTGTQDQKEADLSAVEESKKRNYR